VCRRCATQLSLMMQINVPNDCFYIWHMGPFATINGFKLGRLPLYPVRY
jgi:beclin